MKFLIVGLGNIGSEYDETRHNIGFEILDAFAKASNIAFEADRYAFSATVKHRGKQLILLKPTTYMNLSGKAVRHWMQKEKIPAERMLVITDDLALPFGKIRLRAKGSPGGHNGLKNITELLGNQEWARLRFGVGSDYSKGRQVDYVLGKWNKDELMDLPERIRICTEMIPSFVTQGIARTMSEFNGK